jgi:FLVCR family feline leukemia virus subgroup C receptor-related protein
VFYLYVFVMSGLQQSRDRPSPPLENGEAKLLNTPSTPGDSSNGGKTPDSSAAYPRVYKRRWIMVSLFCLYSLSNAYQWIHLNIIANVIQRYYNESLPEDVYRRETAVDWLSMIYMLAYIPLIFPSTWLLDKRGLRTVAIIGACLNATGAWLKCACISPDRFPVLMFAQTICAIAQIFILGLPARLAAVWFGPNEVSTATSIGVFGNQVSTVI